MYKNLVVLYKTQSIISIHVFCVSSSFGSSLFFFSFYSAYNMVSERPKFAQLRIPSFEVLSWFLFSSWFLSCLIMARGGKKTGGSNSNNGGNRFANLEVEDRSQLLRWKGSSNWGRSFTSKLEKRFPPLLLFDHPVLLPPLAMIKQEKKSRREKESRKNLKTRN